MLLAVAAMVVPSLASYVHTPAAPHENAMSLVVAVILLAVFAITLPASLKSKPAGDAAEQHEPPRWPLPLAVALLAASAIAAAFVSEWFVHALEPAMHALHISEAFAGLVIVAIAGNAVENVVGIQLAAKNRSEYAFSVVINSPLQIALVLAPALVILSRLFGYTPLTLVFPPMLVVSVAIAVLVTAVITFDGESDWGEGVSLLALYAIIATAFWWG
jgi:Ca2+:H+ antiporter